MFNSNWQPTHGAHMLHDSARVTLFYLKPTYWLEPGLPWWSGKDRSKNNDLFPCNTAFKFWIYLKTLHRREISIYALENPWVCKVLQGHFRAKLDSDSTSISSCPTSPISSCVGWIDSEARPADSRRSEKEERKQESECVQAWRISGSWLRQLIKSHPAFSLLLMRGAPDPSTAQTRCWRKRNISLLFKQHWEENNERALVYEAEPLLRWSVWWVCNYLMDWAGID